MRFGEAVNLLWNNGSIDFKNKQVNIFDRPVTKELPPFYVKDYEFRTVPMPCWVIESLEQLKKISDQSNPFAFINYDGFIRVKEKWQELLKDNKPQMWENRFIFNNLKIFKNYCKNAGIDIVSKKVNLHCLRKAYGTNLANLSTPVHTLKELMGHSKIETTMEYYLFSSDENKKKVIEKLDGLFG